MSTSTRHREGIGRELEAEVAATGADGAADRVVPLRPRSPGPREQYSRELHDRLLRAAGDRMWPAWRHLGWWEERAAEEFGGALGELVLLLWTARCFDSNDVAVALCADAIDSTATDSLLADVAEVAFALGAGWAEEYVHSHRSS